MGDFGKHKALAQVTNVKHALMPIAHKHGFFWGGHFSRQDGMHFEIARLT